MLMVIVKVTEVMTMVKHLDEFSNAVKQEVKQTRK